MQGNWSYQYVYFTEADQTVMFRNLESLYEWSDRNPDGVSDTRVQIQDKFILFLTAFRYYCRIDWLSFLLMWLNSAIRQLR